ERSALVREQGAIAASKRNPELQHVADSLMQSALPRLFSGKDDVMASAELVWYLDEVAGKHHVLLNEDATRTAAKPKGGVRTLNVDIRGESDLHGVLEFLQALERGPKLTRVTRLDISKPSRDADDIETVTFAATVSGYALAEAPLVIAPIKSAAVRSDASKMDASSPRGAP
ncbi:MAG: GspMb/PilO family protein, partial [Gemmatimonadaceae bacterium]